MTRCAILLTFALLSFGLVSQAGPDKSQVVYLRVLLPDADAKLLIDDQATKSKGKARLYVTPPLPAGKSFTYTLTARWEKNNYTEVIRARVVSVRAGEIVEVDLRQPDPKRPDDYHIRFVPTPDEVVEAMCKLAKVGKDDVVYDLGCGDGRIVITAVTKFHAKRGVGVDIDADLTRASTANAKEAKVADRVSFRTQDVLTLKDLSDASVVMLYMGEDVNLRLMPILKKSLKPGARIVSHDFPIKGWPADETIRVVDDELDEHVLYLWTIRK